MARPSLALAERKSNQTKPPNQDTSTMMGDAKVLFASSALTSIFGIFIIVLGSQNASAGGWADTSLALILSGIAIVIVAVVGCWSSTSKPGSFSALYIFLVATALILVVEVATVLMIAIRGFPWLSRRLADVSNDENNAKELEEFWETYWVIAIALTAVNVLLQSLAMFLAYKRLAMRLKSMSEVGHLEEIKCSTDGNRDRPRRSTIPSKPPTSNATWGVNGT